MSPPRPGIATARSLSLLVPLALIPVFACERDPASPEPEPEPDPTATARSYAAGSIPPTTVITRGPYAGGIWGTSVTFGWSGSDDDGEVVSYRYARTDFREYSYDHGGSYPLSQDDLIAWVDTLTFRPLPGGGHSGEEVWVSTTADSVTFPFLPPLDAGNRYVFAVRAVDDSDLEDPLLEVPRNFRWFSTSTQQDGPRIAAFSNEGSVWHTGSPFETRPTLADGGLRFEWSASRRGGALPPVTGLRYAVEDTSSWSDWSLENTQWPIQLPGEPETLWFPAPGIHRLWIEARDEAQFVTRLEIALDVFPGPRSCPPLLRRVLVVLDTSLDSYTVFPLDYGSWEAALVESWIPEWELTFHETLGGADPPTVPEMGCASTILWFHTADLDGGAPSALHDFHAEVRNPLVGYVRSGGNLFLCGIQPGNALRYFVHRDTTTAPDQQFHPIEFFRTVDDSAYVPHWAFTDLGISVIGSTIGDTQPGAQAHRRLHRATSQVIAGPNPYPDLAFDPLTFPNGPNQGGFGHYDLGLETTPGTEVLYTANDSTAAIAVRRLTSPAEGGNVVFCGFHPYFLQDPGVRALFRAVLTDFGEPRTRPHKESEPFPDRRTAGG